MNRVLESTAEQALSTNGPRIATTVVATGADLDSLLDEFFAQNPRALPAIVLDFSRRDLYADHD